LRPNLAVVPVGAVLMGLFALYAATLIAALPAAPATAVTLADIAQDPLVIQLGVALFGLAAAGGLFIVPSFAALQMWSAPERRARTIAGVNILHAGLMTVASLALAGGQAAGMAYAVPFLVIAVGSIATAVVVCRAWGRDGIRDLGRAVFNFFYRLEVEGLENLPKPGERAVIAPNHVSLLDGPLLHTVMPDHAAFAIWTGVANWWWSKPFLKLINFFTMDPTNPMATRSLINVVKSGQTLVIFPEGRLTVTGGLMKVYDGTAMIAERADAKIIPVRIEGAERSPFSYLRKTQTKKVWFPKIKITILPPRRLEIDETLNGKARRQAAGAALQDIMTDTAAQATDIDRTLFQALADARRTRDTGKPILEDALGTKLKFKRMITGAQVLGAKLANDTEVGEAVGVLLPNTVGAAVTFFALQSTGRVAAMLNFTAGVRNVDAACEAAAVRTLLTSRAFVEKAHLEDLVAQLADRCRIVYLEDARASISFADKIRGMLAGSAPLADRRPEDPAAILFTSGSEGTPKGVVLSHRNILANAVQAVTVCAANGEDKVFNVLPLFHSFGLTAGLVMPLVTGVPVFLYPSPLHYRIVPELVYQTNATILFGTDTFLTGYARSAHPYDFHNVRMVLAGAEPVKARTRALYMERFGVRILEGYGVTETAPVLAINTPLANRTGTVGRLVPMMEARLEDVPGIDEGGRLFVRGPNVMLGYYRTENPGVLEAPEGGWHDTGDIVEIDAAGFITIKGRAKRFAKIAGEMVSLAAVEALAAALWPDAMSVVVSEPDPRKGERLTLITENAKATRADFTAFAKRQGAAELMTPAEVMVVDRVPVLGSGKADYVSAAKLVAERRAGAVVAAAEAAE
ncbi:MAG: AMP-binding protein, partial [Pseudomonadota bacterium]